MLFTVDKIDNGYLLSSVKDNEVVTDFYKTEKHLIGGIRGYFGMSKLGRPKRANPLKIVDSVEDQVV